MPIQDPGSIASSGMVIVLQAVAANFFIKEFGLRIFKRQDLGFVVDIFCLIFLGTMLYFKIKPFMDVINNVNQGVW